MLNIYFSQGNQLKKRHRLSFSQNLYVGRWLLESQLVPTLMQLRWDITPLPYRPHLPLP